MTTASIKKIVEPAITNNFPITIIGDNLVQISTKGDYIIWDDASELLYVVKTTNNANDQDVTPCRLIVLEYDSIQYIEVGAPTDKIEELLSITTADDNQKKYIKEFFAKNYNIKHKSTVPTVDENDKFNKWNK